MLVFDFRLEAELADGVVYDAFGHDEDACSAGLLEEFLLSCPPCNHV
jgi:hypothetical protein